MKYTARNRWMPPRCFPILGGVWLLAACTLLYAGSVQVTPVRIELDSSHTRTVLQITNRDEQPITIQSRVLTWEFRSSGYVTSATDALLLNPPIFTINPGQTQMVRLGLRRPSEATSELAYRLILEEVPKRTPPGFSGLQLLLQISIPIFVRSAGVPRPQLAWNVSYENDGTLCLSVENRGNAHILIRQLELRTDAGTEPFLSWSLSDYVLPGQTRKWTTPALTIKHPSRLIVRAQTDEKPVDVFVAVNAP